MKHKFLLSLTAAAMMMGLTAALAQPKPAPLPENVVLMQRGNVSVQFGGPTRAEGRSYNNAPTFFIYPDGKLDPAGAEALLAALDLQQVLDEHFGTAFIVNPVGEKYAETADFEAFVELFNRARSGNLKVLGFGEGATFVNQVIAPRAADHIAGIATVGGKPASLPPHFNSYGVPAFVGGKNAGKVAREYETLNEAQAFFEPLLQVVVSNASEPGDVFAEAWEKVFSRNFRFNNYRHTHYEGAKFGEYGPYELEPYADWERLDIERTVVEYGASYRGRDLNGPKYLWYEYWPRELKEGAPAHSVPVVVLLHGNTNDPRTQAETSGFLQVAGEDRFFLVEMEWQGTPNYQAMGHDGIESVLALLLEKYPQLDPSRIYAHGLSAGSMTATALGIKKSHLFAAVGGNSGALFTGHWIGPFPTFETIWAEATQKRGCAETAYCSVFGTMDTTVPYMTPDNWKGNSYLNAWNAYEQMNGMPVVDQMDFETYPIFGQPLRDRETIRTHKGEGIVVETGQLYLGDMPLIKLVAVIDYGHWNFIPAARIAWDFFKHYRRDPESKKLLYTP
jgi:poly(3-hydroxybutyrate) depolymerase